MIEQVLSSVLARVIAEALSKLWGVRVKKEDIEITSLNEEIGKLLVGASIKIPAPEKARLEVTELQIHLPPPVILLPPPPPPAPPIPPPPVILPPISLKLRIL